MAKSIANYVPRKEPMVIPKFDKYNVVYSASGFYGYFTYTHGIGSFSLRVLKYFIRLGFCYIVCSNKVNKK